MNSEKMESLFVKEALYYESAKNILYSDLLEDSNVLMPLLYVTRHECELFLKGALFHSIEKTEIDTSQKIFIHLDDGSSFKIETHNLEKLYVALLLQRKSTIGRDEKECKKWLSFLRSFSKLDPNEEFYRYPLSNKGRLAPSVTSSLLKDSAEPISSEQAGYIAVSEADGTSYGISSFYLPFLSKIQALSSFMNFLLQNFFL